MMAMVCRLLRSLQIVGGQQDGHALGVGRRTAPTTGAQFDVDPAVGLRIRIGDWTRALATTAALRAGQGADIGVGCR
jgi:hypothetical protein